MSIKVAVIIGDYSNVWSDSMVVQTHTKVEDIKQIHEDRVGTLSAMNIALLGLSAFIENSEAINPIPRDNPCCKKFKTWAETITSMDKDVKFCPFCNKVITDERRKKFIKVGD